MPYLEVNGTADSLVTPDEIYIDIFITEKSSKDRIPLEEQEAKMYSSLKAIGINTEKDLAVKDMASNFKSYFLKGVDVIKSRQYQVKVNNAQLAGKVFIELEKLDIANSSIAGVNHSNIENIRFMVKSKAMQNAKEKAVTLTKPLNQSVGMAIHINDIDQAQPIGGVTRLEGISLKKMQSRDGAYDRNTFTDIDFQKISVTENVSVKFAIK